MIMAPRIQRKNRRKDKRSVGNEGGMHRNLLGTWKLENLRLRRQEEEQKINRKQNKNSIIIFVFLQDKDLFILIDYSTNNFRFFFGRQVQGKETKKKKKKNGTTALLPYYTRQQGGLGAPTGLITVAQTKQERGKKRPNEGDARKNKDTPSPTTASRT